MAKLTIAQLREKEVKRLAQFHTDNPTEEDIMKARKLMNSFYRLCGLSERNLYLTNCEHTCNKPSTKESEEREYKWFKLLNKEFREFCGLELVYCGYHPSIGTVTRPGGGFSPKISLWFY